MTGPPAAPPLPTSFGSSKRPHPTTIPTLEEHYATFAARNSINSIAKNGKSTDPFPAGVYFLYNDLMHAKNLVDTLNVSVNEVPRPACIVGYSLAKTKDQKVLLAAVPPQGEMVKGIAAIIEDEEGVKQMLKHTRRFGEDFEVYECDVHYEDEEEPGSGKGWVILFIGGSESVKKPGFLDRARWGRELAACLVELGS